MLASRAPLFEHLIELRWRLQVVLITFFASTFISFFGSNLLFRLLVWPYQRALPQTHAPHLIYTAPQEYFFVQLKLAAFSGFVLTFPALAFHLYRFVAPGLYKHERRTLVPFLLMGPVLFSLGSLLVYFVVMPTCLHFFWAMGQKSGVPIELMPRISEYLDLIINFILAFGLCFQLPLILFLLYLFKFITLQTLRRGRRYAIVIAFIVAAILTPPDVLSQVMLGIPLVFVYELAILAIALHQRTRKV